MQAQQLANMKATEGLIEAQTQATLANAGLKGLALKTEEYADKTDILNPERLAKYATTSANAQTAHEKMRQNLVATEIAEATKADTVTMAAEKIIQMRINNAKTEEEKKVLTERLRILKSEGTLKELDVEFAEKLNKRWDGYLLKILGTLLGK
jgi:hypothetical protein